MKVAKIIFLTRKLGKFPVYRFILSFFIALFTRKKKQKIKDVKVHAAVIYEDNGIEYVRDMEAKGNESILFGDYYEKFKDRIEMIYYRFQTSKEKIKTFNNSCKKTKVKYDYKNTLFFQVIKILFGKFFGGNTAYSRMCSEDVQRQLNILEPIFDKPEEVSPNELYEILIKE